VRSADPAAVLAAARDLRERSFGAATAKYRELGTMANLLAFNAISTLPTRNFSAVRFEGAPALGAEEIAELRQVARDSCASCSIGCEHIYKGPGGTTARMEYENVFALGPMCGVSDPDAVLAASALCDDLGLDTISAGGTIAWAMECVEKGLIDAPWLRFGDSGALLRALDEIGERRGLGDLLAEGSRRAAERVGGGSAAFAPHVKGMEMPGYEPRTLQAMALGLAVNARGADHNRSGAYEADLSGDHDRLAGGEAARLPASLAAAIGDQLATLPPPARSLLELLAVVDAPVPLAVLAEAAGVAGPAAAIEPALRAGLADLPPGEPVSRAVEGDRGEGVSVAGGVVRG